MSPATRLLLLIFATGAALVAAAGAWLLRGDAIGLRAGAAPQASHSSARVASAPSHDRGGQLVAAITVAPSTLLGAFATTDSEIEASNLVSPYLMTVSFRGELLHEPGLAERWEVSPDGLTITFFLKDARWTDGHPITSADVVFTYRVIANAELTAPGRMALEQMREKDPVEAIDARTVRFHYRSRYYLPTQLDDANSAILPEHVFASLKRDEWRGTDAVRVPKVTHGPFRVVSQDASLGWILERNDGVVTTSVPNLKRLVLVPYSSYDARLNALLTGEVDAIDGVKVEDIARLLATGDFEILERGRRYVDFLLWNVSNPLFADREVRRALTMAIDRDGMIQNLLVTKERAFAQPAIGTVPPLLTEAYARDVKPLPFDPKAAAAKLDALGWKLGADGIRSKDGKPFRFTLLGHPETPRRMQTLRMVQQDLQKVGVKADLEEIPFRALGERLEKRRFDASIYGLQCTLQLKQGEIWRTGSPYNYSGYSSAEVDRLTEEQRAESDRDRLCANLRRMQQLIYDDQPVTFLCWFSRIVAVRKRFHDLGADALGFLTRVEGCWVPRDLQRQFKGQ